MKHASLAALYRPQSFAAVAGQHMVTTVMSRAAAEDSVAPAYLLSGTRGVGKTTIARIFAKALNCLHAPASEPCNECDQCLKITQGSHVDVTEIDGASNNSVEDARALREHIGYAAMEGRYKVFIIDEAHMLSKSAFNALLKTLEEPPPRVVFIFATTEAHKFPITIVSRCQHFILKRLSEEGLVAHLTHVLTQESVDYDSAAVRMIARRAAGSVRDSMSLLGQTLAYDEGHLTVEATRQVLGLAGQELFMGIVHSMQNQDCAAVVELCHKLTDQGVDIGFFLRELTQVWRTLFLLREAGASIAPVLSLAEDEIAQWQSMASGFSAAHVHAAWHMTLEAQRKVIHSPEPAAALELLLLNLTLMPRLLPIAHATPQTQSTVPPAQGSMSQGQGSMPPAQNTAPLPPQEHPSPSSAHRSGTTSAPLQVHGARHIHEPVSGMSKEHTVATNIEFMTPQKSAEQASEQSITQALEQNIEQNVEQAQPEPQQAIEPEPVQAAHEGQPIQASSAVRPAQLTWESFCTHLEASDSVVPSFLLRQAQGEFHENILTVTPTSHIVHEQLQKHHDTLCSAAQAYTAAPVEVRLAEATQTVHKSEAELKEQFLHHEEMQACLTILDARINRVRPV